MRMQPRQNLLQGLIACVRTEIPLIVAGSAAVAVMVALILWAKAPDYRIIQQSFQIRMVAQLSAN